MDAILCDCGHYSKPDGVTTGYGIDAEGKTHCFQCCGERDRETMIQTGRATLYLTRQDVDNSRFTVWRVTNWPGTLEIPCSVKKGSHNIAGTRYDVWFKFNGHIWHGVQYGEWTQICHCKQTKQQAK